MGEKVRAFVPVMQFFNDDGSPMVGGHLNTYKAGTSIPVTTYADASGTRNPVSIPLDSRGECVVYLESGKLYKFVLVDKDGVVKWTADNYSMNGGSGGGGGGMPPSILIAQKWGAHYVSGTDDGTDGTTDGIFLFQEKEKLGADIWVDENDHKIYCKKGWYHFDFQVFFFVNPIAYQYKGGTQPRIDTVQVNAGGIGDSLRVDLDRGTTDSYSTTAQFGADIYASFDGFNISATIDGLGYYSYAHVGLMAIHKIAED